MERANKLTCPACSVSLTSIRGVRIGRKITCPACAVAFTVRPEDAAAAEGTAGVSAVRLCIVLVGALAFLSGGAGLAVYCFINNRPHQHRTQVDRPDGVSDDNEGTPEPLAPKTTPPAKSVPGALSLTEQRRIDNAIADGVWFLKDHVLTTGAWGEDIPKWSKGVAVGLAALPALTLLECGVTADDPVVQKAATFVRQQAVRPDLGLTVYQRSLAMLFLDRLGDKKDQELIRYLGLCLMAGQNPTEGAWGYNCPTLDRKRAPQLLKMLKDSKLSLDDWRKSALEDIEFNVAGWDNSNTQFAVLALWVAQRHGVPIARTNQFVEKHFRRTQLPEEPDLALRFPTYVSPDGSWLYDRAKFWSGWPSMTCSGLLALAVAHGLEDTPRKAQGMPMEDQAIKRALAMLAREIDRPGEERPHDYYFLWSLERVGVLYNLPLIGGKDWYAWGRTEILDNQQKDGSWAEGGFIGSSDIVKTCFALLFLKQANLAKDLTDKLELLGSSVSAVPTTQPPAKND